VGFRIGVDVGGTFTDFLVAADDGKARSVSLRIHCCLARPALARSQDLPATAGVVNCRR
jgi:N-methylhydantoinase A/oxoprolinase/acetone carboxylase beta subunit